jgi:fructokinase
MQDLRLGIDLGGTKTEAVVLTADGAEIARQRVPTVKGRYAATLETVSALVQQMELRAGQRFTRFGIGIPGSVSPRTGLVRNANSTWINGKPLALDLERKTGRAIRISNDANCLALSELHDGAAKGAASVFAVILGTGVGGGLVLNRQIVEGAHGLGGEWGHIPLAHEGKDAPTCFCGRRGCMEQYLSGPAIVRDYLASGGQTAEAVEVINARAEAGEDLAMQVLARHLARLGRGLGAIVNVIDPEMFVLGGGVSNLAGLIESLPGVIAPHVFAAKDDMIEIKVRRAKWGDSSGVRGAARLWRFEE